MNESSSEIFSLKPLGGNWYEVTLRAADFTGLISILTGLLASYGINIVRGYAETNGGKARDHFEILAPRDFDRGKFEKDAASILNRAGTVKSKDIQEEIHKRLIRSIRAGVTQYPKKLYPIDLKIDQDSSESETVVLIESQDTFAFLYELSNSLSLLDLNIKRMEIETLGGRIKDKLWLTFEGKKITSEKKLKALQWAILFVKGFSHLLPKVPDPKSALEQFTLLGKDLFERKDFQEVIVPLKTDFGLENLSKVLGTSRFLWEEFIRSQYETIMPILGDKKLIERRKSAEEMAEEIKRALASAPDWPGKEEALNQYKDKEMFRIDLRHLLGQAPYIGEFTEEFADLAEAVVRTACDMAYAQVLEKYPELRSEKIEKNPYAVFGLGKFGGRELGYASDLELLFIYSDEKIPSGSKGHAFTEFYSEMVRKLRRIIHAKSTGVFEIDLRLRPYGKDGPYAVSHSGFRQYYFPGGDAWNFERQALIKLRYIGGSAEFAKSIEEHRDRFVYGGEPFDYQDQLKMRVKQQQELAEPGIWNAKYSAGGLLDVEYLIQALQVTFGGKGGGDMRNPNSLKALRACWQSGIIHEKQFQELRASYIFLRALINALRIVRGNARDLNLPPMESDEYVILGRRMGFIGDDIKIKGQFNLITRHYQQMVSRFYETWLERLRSGNWKTIADSMTVISESMRVNLDNALRGDMTEGDRIAFQKTGFEDPDDAALHLQRTCPSVPSSFESFARVMDKSWALFAQVADPDLALKHLEWFAERLPDKESFWKALDRSDEVLSALLKIFGSSKYLSDSLIFNAEERLWITEPVQHSLALVGKTIQENEKASLTLEQLREIRQRETERIASVEITDKAPLPEIYAAFSDLADFVIQVLLRHLGIEEKVAVVALGKLGGRELNFSSDIDLIFACGDDADTVQLEKKIEEMIGMLKRGSLNEFLFRVDLRLRPHGNKGPLIMKLSDYRHYYENEADAWEFQALIKARPAAGKKELGEQLIESAARHIWREHWPEELIERLNRIKHRVELETREKSDTGIDIKVSPGGIRDVEFTVQRIQLLNASRIPALKQFNTLKALDEIKKHRLLGEKECVFLNESYLFLRKLENRLHLYENRQTFGIPGDAGALRRLGRGMGFKPGDQTEGQQFLERLRQIMASVRKIYEGINTGSQESKK